jgi:hypothetical protein
MPDFFWVPYHYDLKKGVNLLGFYDVPLEERKGLGFADERV